MTWNEELYLRRILQSLCYSLISNCIKVQDHLKTIWVGLSASFSLSQHFLPPWKEKKWLWKNTILSWLSLAKTNIITNLDNNTLGAIYFICIVWILWTPNPHPRARCLFLALCTFNAWKTELSGSQNLAFSCLATTVSSRLVSWSRITPSPSC